MLKHYIISAFRNIFKNRVSAIIAILGLAAGIGCFSFCMYYVHEMKNVNRNFKDSERMVTIKCGKDNLYEFQTYPALASELIDLNLDEIESATTVQNWGDSYANFQKDDGSKQLYNTCLMIADTSIIDVLGMKIIDGNPRNAKILPYSIIITQSLAKEIYGDESAINKDVSWGSFNNQLFIRAVIEDLPDNISIDKVKPEFIILEPEGIFGNAGIEDGVESCLETIVKLKHGYSSKDLNRKFKEIDFYKQYNDDIYRFEAVNYVGIIKTENDIYIFLLLTGWLILIIAILNYIVFISGITKNRYNEYLLRNILGSSSNSLFILISSEIVFTILISGVITLISTEVICNLVTINIPDQRIIFNIDKSILYMQEVLYILAIIILSLFATLFFVKRLHKKRYIIDIKNDNYLFRNMILYIQFFICFIFISGTILVYKQSLLTNKTIYNNFSEQEKENIFYVNLIKLDFAGEFANVINQLKNNPGIDDILFTESKFAEDRYIGMIINDNKELCKYYNVSDNFFRFTNQYISSDYSNLNMEGVYFSSSYNIENLPKTISINFRDDNYKVLGVFDNKLHSILSNKEAKYNLIFVKPEKEFDNINFHYGFSNMYIKCNSQFKGEHKSEIRKVLKPLYSIDYTAEIISMKEEYKNLCWKEIYLRKLLFTLTVICLVITLAGIYSTIKNDTERRKKEVTIRKINGASYYNIAMIFCRIYLWFIIIAAITALPLVWIIAKDYLSDYNVRIDINNPLFWLSVFLLILFFVFLTMFIKIRNIVLLNPCKGLKNE